MFFRWWRRQATSREAGRERDDDSGRRDDDHDDESAAAGNDAVICGHLSVTWLVSGRRRRLQYERCPHWRLRRYVQFNLYRYWVFVHVCDYPPPTTLRYAMRCGWPKHRKSLQISLGHKVSDLLWSAVSRQTPRDVVLHQSTFWRPGLQRTS